MLHDTLRVIVAANSGGQDAMGDWQAQFAKVAPLVTPHLAWLASRPARARYVADAIAAFECGEVPANLYDPARGY